MASQLKNTLTFTNLAAGALIALPHGLYEGTNTGAPLKPDIIFSPDAELGITADATYVFVTNNGPNPASGVILVEAWHTFERAFGDVANIDLPVKPIIIVGASAQPGCPTPAWISPHVDKQIFATATGDDTTGNGSSGAPYKTFQRAVLDVPLCIPSNTSYTIDVTNLGVEIFPPGYTLPTFTGDGISYAAGLVTTNPLWQSAAGNFNIIAIPKVFTGIPAADTVIAVADVASLVADPNTGLFTLTLAVPRASWAANACRGSLFKATNTNQNGDAVVIDSTATTLLLSTATLPVGPFGLFEQSATFSGSAGVASALSGAFNVPDITSFHFNGIKFISAIVGLTIRTNTSSRYSVVNCDLGRVLIQGGGTYAPVFDTCYMHGGTSYQQNMPLVEWRKCYISGITRWDTTPDEGGFYFAFTCVDACVPVGDVTPFGGFGFPTPASKEGGGLTLWLQQCLVRNAPTIGIKALAGGVLNRVTVNASVGDAVQATQSRGLLRLTSVTGTGNGGVGVRVTQNTYVNVDALTVVTGVGGDIKVANNAVRTWADFRALAPLFEENDLAAAALSQMCRLYQT